MLRSISEKHSFNYYESNAVTLKVNEFPKQIRLCYKDEEMKKQKHFFVCFLLPTQYFAFALISLLFENNEKNSLARFQFTRLLVNVKLRGNFLKSGLINTNRGYFNFLVLLNHSYKISPHVLFTAVCYSKST